MSAIAPSGILALAPGQGAQAVGMGRAWFERAPEARAVFEAADRLLGNRLGVPLSQCCFAGPAELLNRTNISQPAIYVASIACWKGLLAKWGFGNGEANLAAAAGLSLGEYTALHVAGAITFEEGLELVTLRGRAMQDAAEAQAGGMLALIGADDTQAEEVCAAARGSEVLVCANFNAPGQVVLSGHKTACERAAKVATERGLRSSILAVAGAFHSPLMVPAADRLREALVKTPIRQPRCPVVSNVTARPHAADGSRGIDATIRDLLTRQLTSPVRWADSCRWLLANPGSETEPKAELHELAPGGTLAGLMRRIDRSAKVISHDQPE
ncbi:MAG: ACP S-malonyltransferase [Phycisphaerales bacterium]